MKGYNQISKNTEPLKGNKRYYGPVFYKALDGVVELHSPIGSDYTLTSFLMSLEARLIKEKIIKPGEIVGLVEKL